MAKESQSGGRKKPTGKGTIVGGGTLSRTANPSTEGGKVSNFSSVDAAIAKGAKAVGKKVVKVAKEVGHAFNTGVQSREYAPYDPADYKDSGTQANHAVTKVDRKTGKATN